MMKNARNVSHDRGVHAEDNEGSDINAGDILNERVHLQVPSRSKKARLLATFKAHQWLVDAFLLLVVVILLSGRIWMHRRDRNYLEGNGDITGFAPACEAYQNRRYVWKHVDSWSSAVSQQFRKSSPDPSVVLENTSEFFSRETREIWLGLVLSMLRSCLNYNTPS